jgi:hypothetical protein
MPVEIGPFAKPGEQAIDLPEDHGIVWERVKETEALVQSPDLRRRRQAAGSQLLDECQLDRCRVVTELGLSSLETAQGAKRSHWSSIMPNARLETQRDRPVALAPFSAVRG